MTKIITDDKHYQDIADALRINGAFDSDKNFYPKDMANSVSKVFTSGKQAEQREFWDILQVSGTRTNWQYAFYNTYWNDKIYNPIYPIKIGSSNTNMFYRTPVTNTKVSLDISGITLNYTFREAEIVTIPELIVDETTDINQGFTSASKLANVTITGTLGKSMTMSACPLSVESLKSIITHLKDYTGTTSEYTYTLTFKSSAFSALSAEGATSPNGNTWAEYIDDLKWNLTLA